MSEPITFPIRTLQDIYKLPTIAQVEQCLKELSSAMIQTRAANDMLSEIAKEAGIPLPEGMATEWPEVSHWIDDGKGEVDLKFTTEDGQELMRISTEGGGK